MTLFDKLSKTVSEAGQKTIAKTRELADTSKLNSMISGEEKIIADLYLQIGKLYVSLHKEDSEEAFSGMITAIAEAEAKIRDCKKQIQDIKGTQSCVKGGAEMPKAPGSDFADYVKCESCRAYVKKSMRFCTACGKPMNTVTAAPVVTDTVHKKECPNCGAIAEGEMAFCTECGTKLS